MSERDLELKLKTARWFWSMGSAVVLRVRLTTYAATSRPGSKRHSAALTDLADLDVLGIDVGPDFTVRFRAAECKSAKAGAKELFWLRGVLDYFGGGDGYLVAQRDEVRTPALRELAARLRLGVVTFNDFAALAGPYPSDPASDLIFSPAAIEQADMLLQQPGRGVERLTDYALRFCWQLPQHRNLQQAVGYLRATSSALRSDQRQHVLLFGEVVFRYMLALDALAAVVLRRGLPHTHAVALAYLHGGELGLHEVQQRVRSVRTLQQHLEGEARAELDGIFTEAPPYFDAMVDVVERIVRRPELATAALRQLIVALRGVIVAERSSAALMPDMDPLATKLVNDVAAFLTRAAGVDRELREPLAQALEVPTSQLAQSGGPATPVVKSTPPPTDLHAAQPQVSPEQGDQLRMEGTGPQPGAPA
jgi:hypothetical protein